MYLTDNPVLQRELLGHFRLNRTFVLLLVYLALLGGMVWMAWPVPEDGRLDLTRPREATRLLNLFFLGQYILVLFMAPSLAAGAITGEKEHKTYEMLLATPLRPRAILLGKLLAALLPLVLWVFCSFPIAMLVLPLGGVSLYELLAAYTALLASAVMFGTISLAWSSYFQHTSAALVVSYMTVLPLAILAIWFWVFSASTGSMRLWLLAGVVPGVAIVSCGWLLRKSATRLLWTPDLGSEGKEAIDPEAEARHAVGLVIDRDQFPDKLFAPAKRTDVMEDGTNPVYDKEMRSEIFSQGTLMLRFVIQISMLMALPLTAALLYIWPHLAAWYLVYVVLFNMLVGPVFLAGSVAGERQRETLDLLLTTILSPWQILWGKLLSGLRVSSVLTSFLLWPVVLACIMPIGFWTNLPSIACYFAIVAGTCVTTALTALFCSVLFSKTSTSTVMSYLAIIALFVAGPAAYLFATTVLTEPNDLVGLSQVLSVSSPLAALFAVPLDFSTAENAARLADWPLLAWHALFVVVYNLCLLGGAIGLLNRRWQLAQ